MKNMRLYTLVTLEENKRVLSKFSEPIEFLKTICVTAYLPSVDAFLSLSYYKIVQNDSFFPFVNVFHLFCYATVNSILIPTLTF